MVSIAIGWIVLSDRRRQHCRLKEMAEQPPPPYSGTDPEKAQLLGELSFALPPDAQHASSEAYPPQYSVSPYPPPPAGAQGQPLYPPQSTQPAPYPYPPAGATGYPASAPPSSVPAVSELQSDMSRRDVDRLTDY